MTKAKANKAKVELLQDSHKEVVQLVEKQQQSERQLWESRIADSGRREHNQHQLMLASMLLGHRSGGDARGQGADLTTMLRGLLSGSASSGSGSSGSSSSSSSGAGSSRSLLE